MCFQMLKTFIYRHNILYEGCFGLMSKLKYNKQDNILSAMLECCQILLLHLLSGWKITLQSELLGSTHYPNALTQTVYLWGKHWDIKYYHYWFSAFLHLSLVRRLTLDTGGISSILPRVQLGVYIQSSGSLIGNRHWLGSVFKGAYMEQPMKGWDVSGLYTKEKS